jgi:hypothetical protein
VRGAQAAIMCNECGVVVQSVAVEDVEETMAKLAETDTLPIAAEISDRPVA